MMGLPMGELDRDGGYPPGSLNDRIQRRLAHFADRWHEIAVRNASAALP